MAGNKTVATAGRVDDFIAALEDTRRREECRDLLDMMQAICGCEPRMWGDSIVGFGQYHYRYDSGREGDCFVTGFSPRKATLTIYVMPGFDPFDEALAKLGPHRTGKSCLYLKRLDGVDRDVLRSLLDDAVGIMRERYPCSF